MALAENDIEERLLTLERKILRLRSQADAMNTWRISSVEQQLAALWMLPPRRVAQITGQIDGCASQGFPGATVRILNADGERLGTGVADASGHYTALANLESDPQTVTVEATPVGTYAARFDGPATDTLSANVGENTAPTVTIPPTEDWCCGETDYFPGVCDCNPDDSFILVTITNFCTSAAVSGATVTIKLGGVTVASGSTDGSGQYSTPITLPGNYTIDVSKSGFTPLTGVAFNGVVCGTTNTKTVVIVPNTGSIAVSFRGNCEEFPGVSFPIPGATVTATQGGSTVATGTTNSSGTVTLSGVPFNVSTTVTAVNSDYSSSSGSTTLTITGPCPAPVAVNFSVALNANHRCACNSPTTCLVSTTLQLTDSYFGSCTLTWNSLNKRWEGEISGADLGCPDLSCPPTTGRVYYSYGYNSVAGTCDCIVSAKGYFPTPGNLCYQDGTRAESSGGAVKTTSGSCSPFSWTGVFAFTTTSTTTAFGPALSLYCVTDISRTETITITE